METKDQDQIKRWEKKLCRESKSLEAMATSLCGYGYYDPNGIPKEAIIKYLAIGAEWQKQQMINKACEWLKRNLLNYTYSYNGEVGIGMAEFIKQFGKAIED